MKIPALHQGPGWQSAAGGTSAYRISLSGNRAGARQTGVGLATRRVNGHRSGDQQGVHSLSGRLAATWRGRTPAGRVARAHEKRLLPNLRGKGRCYVAGNRSGYGSKVRRSAASTSSDSQDGVLRRGQVGVIREAVPGPYRIDKSRSSWNDDMVSGQRFARPP